MKLQIEDLGKVSITVEAEFWNKTRAYPKLTIVSVEDAYSTFISRKPVPSNTELTNRQYWIPFSNLKEEIVINYNAFKAYVMEQLAQQQVYIDGKFAIERERIDELFANKSAEIDLHIQTLDRIVEQQSARLDAQDRDIQAISDRVTTVEYKVDNISTQMILPLIEEILSTRPIVQDANYVHTDNNYTTSEKNKLGALPTDTQLANFYLKKADAQELYQPIGTYLTPSDVDTNPTSGRTNPVSSGGVKSALDSINGKIPSEASSSNKLADKDFVNSSIATNTATYRGSYNLITDLGEPITATNTEIGTTLDSTIQTRDKNDYCFVQIPVSAESPTTIAQIRRFKFNGTNWLFEYVLNNSGFTQAQWDAINSFITSALVIKLQNLPTYAELLTLLGTLLPKTEAAATYQPIGDYATNTALNTLSGELDEAELDIAQNADDIRQIKNALINIQIAGIVILRKTYAELKELRDNNGLIEGCYYRITDYVTTTVQDDTRSAGHQFDVIVMALSENTLSEEAHCAQHEGDTYYTPDQTYVSANFNLSKMKIWYSLDNIKHSASERGAISIDGVWYNKSVESYDVSGAAYPYKWIYADVSGATVTVTIIYSESRTPAIGDTVYASSDGTGDSYTIEDYVVGKGVITRMIDFVNNDFPYDFTNIQYRRYKTGTTYLGIKGVTIPDVETDYTDYKWVLTFASSFTNGGRDYSMYGAAFNCTCVSYSKPSTEQKLPNIIVLRNSSSTSTNNCWFSNCKNITIGGAATYTTFKNCEKIAYLGGTQKKALENAIFENCASLYLSKAVLCNCYVRECSGVFNCSLNDSYLYNVSNISHSYSISVTNSAKNCRIINSSNITLSKGAQYITIINSKNIILPGGYIYPKKFCIENSENVTFGTNETISSSVYIRNIKVSSVIGTEESPKLLMTDVVMQEYMTEYTGTYNEIINV